MSDIVILSEETEKRFGGGINVSESFVNEKSSFTDKLNRYFISLQRVKIKEKVVFFRLLSTMINA